MTAAFRSRQLFLPLCSSAGWAGRVGLTSPSSSDLQGNCPCVGCFSKRPPSIAAQRQGYLQGEGQLIQRLVPKIGRINYLTGSDVL